MAVETGRWTVAAVGSGGIADMSAHMDDSMVMWALQRIQIGSGTFTRKKLVAMICNGESTPVMQRAKLKANTPEAMNILGSAHSTVEVTNQKECSVDFVLGEVLPIFVADGGDFTAAKLREEYDISIKEARVKSRLRRLRRKARSLLAFKTVRPQVEAEAPVETMQPSGPASTLEAQKAKADVTLDQALDAVARPNGAYNWLVVEPLKLALHNAGCGGFEEMKDWLAADKVMFGVFRLSFKEGGASAVKHVFVHWIGPNVSTVKRGQWNAKVTQAEEVVRGYCSINAKKTYHGLEDMDLSEVVHEMARLTYDTGDNFGDVVTRQRELLCQDYLASVQEDFERADIIAAKQVENAKAEALGNHEDVEEEPGEFEELPSLDDGLAAVRSTGGEWNWMLIRCND